MTRLSAFPPSLGGEIAIPREAAVLVGNILAALAAGFRGQVAVLAEAPLFIWNALSALGCDCALLFRIH